MNRTCADRLRQSIVVFVAVAAALAGSFPSFAAQAQPGEAAAANRIVTRWDRVLQGADELLSGSTTSAEAEQRKAAKKARRQLSTVFADCLKAALSGEAVERRLALAFVLDGVAAGRLGEAHESSWSRYSALALWPEAADWDLSAYGEAARFDPEVEEAEATAQLEDAIANPVSKEELEKHLEGGAFRPPKATAKPKPRIRPSRSATRSGRLVVRFQITPDGMPRAPRVMQNSVPSTYLAAALLSYGDWRFDPGATALPGLLTVQTMRIRW